MGNAVRSHVNGDAVFSDDYRFRYRLERRRLVDMFDRNMGTAVFVMLNPSIADGTQDDPTLRRCKSFAFDTMRADRLIVINLYAFRATDPRELIAGNYPVGPDNDRHVRAALEEATAGVVVGWGRQAQRSRVEWFADEAMHAGRPLWCLKRNADGSPMHPLYASGSSQLLPWRLP